MIRIIILTISENKNIFSTSKILHNFLIVTNKNVDTKKHLHSFCNTNYINLKFIQIPLHPLP